MEKWCAHDRCVQFTSQSTELTIDNVYVYIQHEREQQSHCAPFKQRSPFLFVAFVIAPKTIWGVRTLTEMIWTNNIERAKYRFIIFLVCCVLFMFVFFYFSLRFCGGFSILNTWLHFALLFLARTIHSFMAITPMCLSMFGLPFFCNGFDLPHMASKCQRFHAAITSFALHQRLNVPRMKKINYAIYCHLIKLGIIMFHRVTLLQQSIIYVHHTVLLFFFVGTELHSRWKLSREILSSN